MKRVAVVFEYPTLNGGERSMLSVFDNIDRSKFDIVAIAPSFGRLAAALKERGIQHVAFCPFDDSGVRRTRPDVLADLAAAIEAVAPDLVHANSLSMGVLVGLLENFKQPRLSHIRDMMSLSKAAVSHLNGNTTLIAVSHATREYHIHQGMEADKLHVIHNGVDCEQFRPRRKPDTLTELGLPDDAIVTLTIGQIGLRKGLETLARAIVIAGEKLPNLHCLIVGERHSSKPESLQYEPKIRARLEEGGMSLRTHWLGYRSDVSELMNAADMLVHCAHQEPFGRVLLEATASGLPVIATDVGGTSEIVAHGKTGWLVPKGDETAIADAIVQLHSEPERRNQYAEAARANTEQNLNVALAAAHLSRLWSISHTSAE